MFGFSIVSWFKGRSGGDAGSASDCGHTPPGVRTINDSLYELYAPEGVAKVDVIFFHGIQAGDYRDAYWKTWSSDGTMSTLWPRTLLAEKFLPQARILAVSYDSSARKSRQGGQSDLYAIAESLVNDIIESEAASVGQGQRPILLVGHSLGGLVIKEFILMAQKKRNDLDENDPNQTATITTIDNFLHNLRGVFYYATPHHGSKLADIASKLPGNSDVLIFLKTLSKETERLNEDFRKWRAKHKKQAYSIAEGLPTQLSLVWGSEIIVTEASVRNDSDSYKTAFRDDHISSCKPKSTTSNSFQFLLELVKKTVPEEESTDISMEESLL